MDLSSEFLCGYFKISGLTKDLPDLVTYFEAEIIGKNHSFLTRKWVGSFQLDYEPIVTGCNG